MSKLSQPISSIIFLVAFLVPESILAQTKYELNIRAIDKDSTLLNTIGLQNSFASRTNCVEYVNKIPSILQSKGYISASMDTLNYDSTSAQLVLFLGEAYRWAHINTDQVNPSILSAVGWRTKTFPNKPMDFNQLQSWQDKIVDYLESKGHPFAKVYLDSVQILEDNKVSAQLQVVEGPLYKIDSVRVFGNVKISHNFLQHYLEIPDGTIYNRE